jgi:hypothetical protein
MKSGTDFTEDALLLYEARHSNLPVEAVAFAFAFAEPEKRFDTNRKSKKQGTIHTRIVPVLPKYLL